MTNCGIPERPEPPVHESVRPQDVAIACVWVALALVLMAVAFVLVGTGAVR